MLNITSHQGNGKEANPVNTGISLYPEWSQQKILKTTNAEGDAEKPDHSFTAGSAVEFR